MPMLDVDSTSIYYTVKGNGTPIVFIHPPLLTSMNFTYQIDELSKYYKVITFDMRGHGRSQSSKQPITYPIIVEDIKKLLAILKIKKAFICGYSTGGSIVLEFLRSSADQALGGIVISGMSEVSDKQLKKKVSLGLKLAKAGAVSVLALSIAWSNSNTYKLFIKMVREAQKGDAKNIAQYYQYSLNYNCTNQLENIKLPVLLVYGKKDQIFQTYAKLLHMKLPNNEFVIIDHVKHQIPTKAANRLNQTIKQFITHEKA